MIMVCKIGRTCNLYIVRYAPEIPKGPKKSSNWAPGGIPLYAKSYSGHSGAMNTVQVALTCQNHQ